MYDRPLTPEERMMRQILSRKNNPYGTPTTMESQVNAAVNAPMTPGTGGFGAPPVTQSVSGGAGGGAATGGPTVSDLEMMSKDYTSEMDAVDSQRQIAQQMRSGASPQGRTVGPYDVYVAPNWGDVAGDVALKLGGGYLEGKANEKGRGIDEKVSEQKLAKALEEKRIRDEAQAYREGRDTVTDEQAERTAKLRERQQKEVERANRFSETMSEKEFRQASEQMALDAIEMEPVQYLREDGSKLYVGYRMNEGNSAVEPYNLDTGKKVNMGELTFDVSALDDGKSFNEPLRFVDSKTGDERMLSWNKGGYYIDAFNKTRVEPEEIKGWTPEAAMSESQREKAVADWVKNNGQTLELMHDIQAANAVFQKNNPNGDPGMFFNWFTKQKGPAGDVFRVMADVGEDGAPTQDAYAAATTVFNAISRMRAGLSQTVSEIDRINEETGKNLFVSPEVMIQYWDRLGDKVATDLARAEETMSPRTMQALQRWRLQKGQDGLSSGFTGTRSGRGIGGTVGEDGWITLPNGVRVRKKPGE